MAVDLARNESAETVTAISNRDELQLEAEMDEAAKRTTGGLVPSLLRTIWLP